MKRSMPLLLAVVLVACAEDPEPPPILWEGEHLRFGTFADDSVICGGTLPYLDEVVAHLGSVFGRPDAIVDYYWMPDGVQPYCETDALGCSEVDGAFSRFVVHQHELVHAVRHPSQAYLPFEEGIADAFGDDWDPPPYEHEGEIGELLRNPADHFPGNGYALAGHFVSYLRSTHGIEPLIELDAATAYDSSFSSSEQAFARAFGISLDDAIADYEASYPWCPMRAYRDKTVDCSRNLLPAPTEVGARVDRTVSLACEDPTVIGPRFGARWNTAAVEVEVEGRYYFNVYPEGETDVEFARLTRCELDCFGFADDGFSQTTGNEFGFGECLEPGRYLFRFASAGAEGGGMHLSVSFTEARDCG